MPLDIFLDEVVQSFVGNLKLNLVGVYLHGSLAMGCFNTPSSDIDLLIVVNEKLSLKTKKNIITELLKLENRYRMFKLEMSIVLSNSLIEFEFPTPFELHYSKDHKEKYLKEKNYVCGGDVDPDLAAHIYVTQQRGICLYGLTIKETFKPIEKKYFIKSILSDVENALERILIDPVYTVLNLCRVLYFLKEGVVSSKKEGGEWGVKTLNSKYIKIVSACTKKYVNSYYNIILDYEILTEFVEYMKKEINEQLETRHSWSV
jgi:streptomycin 3"-adenylyltransferase